jgi:hypothetical protein
MGVRESIFSFSPLFLQISLKRNRGEKEKN